MHEQSVLVPRIILIHAEEDKTQVAELYHGLTKAGYRPWLDQEDLPPGQNWQQQIKNIIDDPYNLVVVYPSSNLWC